MECTHACVGCTNPPTHRVQFLAYRNGVKALPTEQQGSIQCGEHAADFAALYAEKGYKFKVTRLEAASR